MRINLSIKNVPEALADALRARAQAHHRSLQGELMSILEAAVGPSMPAQQPLADYSVDRIAVKRAGGKADAEAAAAASGSGTLSLQQLWQRSSTAARKARVNTVDESAALIREDRDRR